METFNNIYNFLPYVVFAAIPVTLLWFCWRLYKFCKSAILTKRYEESSGSPYERIHKVETGFVRRTYQDGRVTNNATSEWLDYTCAASGAPGVPPKHHDRQ